MRGRVQIRDTDAPPHLLLSSPAHSFHRFFLPCICSMLHARHLELQLFELLLTLVVTDLPLPPHIFTGTCVICQLQLSRGDL